MQVFPRNSTVPPYLSRMSKKDLDDYAGLLAKTELAAYNMQMNLDHVTGAHNAIVNGHITEEAVMERASAMRWRSATRSRPSSPSKTPTRSRNQKARKLTAYFKNCLHRRIHLRRLVIHDEVPRAIDAYRTASRSASTCTERLGTLAHQSTPVGSGCLTARSCREDREAAPAS